MGYHFFPWEMCQTAYGPSTVLALGNFSAPPSVHPGRECTVPQLPVPFSLEYGHLSFLSDCPLHWELDHHCLPSDRAPFLFEKTCLSLPCRPCQCLQMHLLTWSQGYHLRGLSVGPCDPAHERTLPAVSEPGKGQCLSAVAVSRGHLCSGPKVARSCPFFRRNPESSSHTGIICNDDIYKLKI